LNLIILSDFMHALNINRKHYSKNDYFSTHTLFSTIYLLQEHELNHRNYPEQELNMVKFLHETEHDVHMYAKFGHLTFYGFLQLITPIFELYEFSMRQ
jgi:hypothetical protein